MPTPRSDTLQPHHPDPHSFWDLDHPITARMDWRGWLGIALMALLAALPLLSAVFTPEPKQTKAVRVELKRSQAEVNQAYLDLAAARARRIRADKEAARGHQQPR